MKPHNDAEPQQPNRSYQGPVRPDSPLYRLLELVAEFIARKRLEEQKTK